MNKFKVNEKKTQSDKCDLIDIEKQIHRELEGDDTITPLTNATFLKQFTKLKHQTATLNNNNNNLPSKSINSLKSSSSNSFNSTCHYDSKNEDQTSIKSFLSRRISVPERFQKLFSKKTSPKFVDDLQFFTKTKLSHNKVAQDFVDSDNMKASRFAASIDDLFKQTSNENDFTFDKGSLLKTSYKNSLSTATKLSNSMTFQSVTTVVVNNTDQVFDAISSIMTKNVIIEKDLIESVRFIVRQSELIRKRRIDTSIFMCRVFLFSFLIFMAAFFFGFFYTLNVILNEFKWLIDNDINKNNDILNNITSFK